jgi:hypothetical protein
MLRGIPIALGPRQRQGRLVALSSSTPVITGLPPSPTSSRRRGCGACGGALGGGHLPREASPGPTASPHDGNDDLLMKEIILLRPQKQSLCLVNDQPVGNPKRKV